MRLPFDEALAFEALQGLSQWHPAHLETFREALLVDRGSGAGLAGHDPVPWLPHLDKTSIGNHMIT
jgi:hypothetical protein